jgi:hypothetical protein
MSFPHELSAACEKTVGALVGAHTPDFHTFSEMLNQTDHIYEKPRLNWVLINKTGFKMAPAAGFEPATNWLTDACLNLINQGYTAYLSLNFLRLCLYLCFSLLLSPFSVKLLNNVTSAKKARVIWDWKSGSARTGHQYRTGMRLTGTETGSGLSLR